MLSVYKAFWIFYEWTHSVYEYFHYYTIQQKKTLFLLMNASRNILKASYKLHHVGEKKAGL